MDLESRSDQLAELAKSLPQVPESSSFFIDPTVKRNSSTGGIRSSCFDFVFTRKESNGSMNRKSSPVIPVRFLDTIRASFSSKLKKRHTRSSEDSSQASVAAVDNLWMDQNRYKNLSKLTHAKWSGISPDETRDETQIDNNHNNNSINHPQHNNSIPSDLESTRELIMASEAPSPSKRTQTASTHLWTPLFRTKQLEACIQVLQGGTSAIVAEILRLTQSCESWIANWTDHNLLTYYCWLYCTSTSTTPTPSLCEQVLVPEYTDPLSALTVVVNRLALLLEVLPESEAALSIIGRSWVAPDPRLTASVSKRREQVTLMTLFDEIVEEEGDRPSISGPSAARFDHFINSKWRAHAVNVAAIGYDEESQALEESKRRRLCVMDGTDKSVFILRDCRCASRKAIDRLVCTECSLQWYINRLARSQDCTMITCVGGCGARVVLADLLNLIETDEQNLLLHRRVLESHRLHFPGFVYCPSRAGCSDGMRLESADEKVTQHNNRRAMMGAATFARNLPVAIVAASRVGQVIGRLTGMVGGGGVSVSGELVPLSPVNEDSGTFDQVDASDDDSDDSDDEDDYVIEGYGSDDFTPRPTRVKSVQRGSDSGGCATDNYVHFNCAQCLFDGCLLCGSHQHPGESCEHAVVVQAQQERQRADFEYQCTLQRVLDQGAKLPSRANPMSGKLRPCFYCGFIAERLDACNSIKCGCCHKNWHWNHGSPEVADRKVCGGKHSHLYEFAREIRQYEPLRPPTFTRSAIGLNRGYKGRR